MNNYLKIKWIEEDLTGKKVSRWTKEIHYGYLDNGKDDIILATIVREYVFPVSTEEDTIYYFTVKGETSKPFSEKDNLDVAKFKAWLRLCSLLREGKLDLDFKI